MTNMYKFVCRNCGMHFKGSSMYSTCPSCHMTGEREESSSSSCSHDYSYDHDDDDYSFSTGSSGSSFDSFGSFGGGVSDGGGCSGDW